MIPAGKFLFRTECSIQSWSEGDFGRKMEIPAGMTCGFFFTELVSGRIEEIPAGLSWVFSLFATQSMIPAG